MTEAIIRTPEEWRSLRDAIDHWYGVTLNWGMLGGNDNDSIDNALDLIEEINRRFGDSE